ncbi:MAG TPA: hypothetical protein VFB12_12970 [Ktedonobacteraceae bacterium]|nr:hypothetical protein [Ktedonobacteraceae bacterium]
MSKTLENAPAQAQTNKIDPRVLLLMLGMFALGTDAFGGRSAP